MLEAIQAAGSYLGPHTECSLLNYQIFSCHLFCLYVKLWIIYDFIFMSVSKIVVQ